MYNFPCHIAMGIHYVSDSILENWEVFVVEKALSTKEAKVTVYKIDEYKKDTIHFPALNMYNRINCV